MTSQPEPPEAHSKPLDYKEMFEGRHVITKFIDPCENASKASMECMARTGDRNSCLEYFQAYRECKAAWLDKRRKDRRSSGKVKQ